MISEATRKKMSKAHTGMKMPERSILWRKRQSIVQKKVMRHPHSEATKKKIGDAQRGEKNHAWGKPNTEEQKRKIRKALKNRVFSPLHRIRISIALLGDKHPNWKGGITPVRHLIRTNEKYNSWRICVLIRDGRECVRCGSKKELEADHFPISFARLLRENEIDSIQKALACKALWSAKNGRTLCKTCHKRTKNWGNRKRKCTSNKKATQS